MKVWHDWKTWLFCLPVAAASGGCSMVKYSVSNLHYEPSIHHWEHQIKHDLRSQARETYKDYLAAHPEECFSAYFKDGFIDGFSDYLNYGGQGEPPAMPPSKYRKNKYLTPEGYAALEDYFSGFRLGARIAMDSGIRETLVVPILVPVVAPPVRQTPAPPPETLPVPKLVDEGDTPKAPAMPKPKVKDTDTMPEKAKEIEVPKLRLDGDAGDKKP
jgi:hypothetical protein